MSIALASCKSGSDDIEKIASELYQEGASHRRAARPGGWPASPSLEPLHRRDPDPDATSAGSQSVTRQASNVSAPKEAPSSTTVEPRIPTAPFGCDAPRLVDVVRRHATLLLLPLVLLLVSIVATFAVVRPPLLVLYYLLAYGSAFVASVAWIFLAMARQVQRLLRTLGADVPLVLSTSSKLLSSVLSPDDRVLYVQLCVYDAFTRTRDPSERSDGGDNLAFMRKVIAEKAADAAVGHCVVDPSGTILWCNDALAAFFRYDPGALVGENVRDLMPDPYRSQHDGFLQRYDRAGRSHVVGSQRRVPVVDKLGKNHTVMLAVREYADPADHDSFVFLGSISFRESEEQVDPVLTIQEAIGAGATDVTKCCAPLTSHPDNLVLADSKGIILWVNDAATMMLQYSFGELVGKSINCLMSDEHAKQHDALLAGYLRRVDAATKAGAVAESAVVGRSRDLYTRTKGGDYVRIFLRVQRIEALSRSAPDSLFLAAMLVVQTTKDALLSAQPSVAGASSPNAPTTLKPLALALSPWVPRKCTVLAFEVFGLQAETSHRDYQLFLNALVPLCSRYKATIQHPVGCRVVVTLNHPLSNSAHRSHAGNLLNQLMSHLQLELPPSALRVYATGCSGYARTAQYQKSPVLMTELYDMCAALLRVACAARTSQALIDPTLHDELQYAFDCRVVNVLTFVNRNSDLETHKVYELHALKDVADDEWMYQYQARQQQRQERLLHWKECWQALDVDPHAGAGVPDFARAIAALDRHLAGHPEDAVGQWLREALRCKQTTRAPMTWETAGKLSFAVHYHAEWNAGQPVCRFGHSGAVHPLG